LGASGAIEAAIACLSIERGWIPPTLNLEQPDDDCDLDYVPDHGRELRPHVVLSNSFGSGGINAYPLLRGASRLRRPPLRWAPPRLRGGGAPAGPRPARAPLPPRG